MLWLSPLPSGVAYDAKPHVVKTGSSFHLSGVQQLHDRFEREGIVPKITLK